MNPSTIDGESELPVAYSPGDSLRLGLETQIERIVEKARQLVANGIVSERGLAKCIGMSQPHIHHLLSGERQLTVAVADRLLAFMKISAVDLFEEGEILSELESRRRQRGARLAVPVRSGRLGPAGPFPQGTSHTALIECGIVAGCTRPLLVALGPDPEMTGLLGNATHALLHHGTRQIAWSVPLFAVELNDALVVRGVRPGARCSYIVTGRNSNRPEQWERTPKLTPHAAVIPIRSEARGLYSIAIPDADAAS